MKPYLLAAAALILVTPVAVAQVDRGEGRGDRRAAMQDRLAQLDTNGNGAISRDEANAARTAHFAEIDTDGDGVATFAEYEAHQERRRTERRQAAYNRSDLNGDGVVSQDEFLTDDNQRFARADRNGDGEITQSEMREAARARREAGRGGRRGQ